MSQPEKHCYSNFADKRKRYPSETLPAMARATRNAVNNATEAAYLLNWLGEIINLARGKNQLELLHELVRSGSYLMPAELACDPIQMPGATIVNGGDCDQWAVVLATALHLLGYSEIYFVSVGTAIDPAKHLAVAVDFGEQFYLDPKPHQRGVDFNQRSENFPVVRYFQVHVRTARISVVTPLGAKW